MQSAFRLYFSVFLVLTTILSATAGEQPAPSKNDWSGWWFVYHRDSKGELVLDKFTVAWVINDKMQKGSGKVTGQWVGCVWSGGGARMRYGQDSLSLSYAPHGERETFRMTRTGPDEAEGIYLDEPNVKYVAKRTRNHGNCAGYASNKKQGVAPTGTTP